MLKMLDLLKTHRKNLHQIPEIAYKEFKTRAYIMKHLKNFSCEIIEPDTTSICAFFNVSKAETIALRADMDALPNNETTGLEYSSLHKGMMHSCGHDGHMAMLLCIAMEIDISKDKLGNNVLLIFQHAEEGGGGAKKICDTGLLEKLNVTKIYGYHLWPGITKHAISARPGYMLAKSSQVNIFIIGKNAHIANVNMGIDALYIGCKFICELYETIEREVSKDQYKLLKFGKMNSGIVRNSISGKTEFEGTMRCFDEKLFDFMLEKLFNLAKKYEVEFGCTFKIEYNEGYPPVVNDSQTFEDVKKLLSKKFNFETLKEPYMQGEDFAFYLKRVPGNLLLLGIGDTPSLHSEKFNFDENVLLTGVEAYKVLLSI